MNSAPPPPPIPKLPPVALTSGLPRITTLRGPVLLGGGIVVFVSLVAWFILSTSHQQLRARQAQETPPAPAIPTLPEKTLKTFPATYGEALATPAVTPQVATTPAGTPLPPQAIPLAQTVPATTPGNAAPPPKTPVIPPRQASGRTAPLPQKKEVQHWMFSGNENALGKAPFPEDKKAEEKAKTSKLLKDADWILPAQRTRVLYKTQPIPVLSLQRISSDIPQSDVRLHVTRNVMDRWQTNILIPQGSLIAGTTQANATSYGQTRLSFLMQELYFPDGTILDLAKAKLNDASGQAGMTGAIDNHYGKLILGAGMSALLSIGARAPFGSPQGFQPSLGQDYANDVGQSLQQSGNRILQRETQIPPTITVKEGEEGVMTLQENLSLAKPPDIVK